MTGGDRRPLLATALGFALLEGDAPELALVRAWLGNWSGIGLVAAVMARPGYDLELTRYDERGWRATFFVTGIEHSPTGATGTAWEPTPWLPRRDRGSRPPKKLPPKCTAPGFPDTEQAGIVSVSVVASGSRRRETAMWGNTQIAAPLVKSSL